MTDQTDDQKIREAMSLLGKRTSERKTNASRLNIAYASSCRVLKSCSCGAFPHRQPCPVYRREQQQKNRERMAAGVEWEPKPCSCGAFPHRAFCAVYRREAQQKNRAKQSVS